MKTAILVRHGESEFSVRGAVNGDPAVVCPLTERGREQARALGRTLVHERIELCVTSAFPRVVETADVALDGREVPRLVFRELNDPKAGEFEGGPLSRYRGWAHSHTSADEPPGGGESRVSLVSRYARGFRRVLERPEEVVLVVAHSLPIAYVLRALDGAGPVRDIPVVDYAVPHRLEAAQLERAIECLEAWAAAPTW
ncbi:MAG: histidine phosphatase family protein [Actinomycetota bacterium]|nr:histidine phosphatase family protein [Actinomycetota bacterium]